MLDTTSTHPVRFRPNLQVMEMEPGSYCVVSEYDTFLLQGPALATLVPLLDGTRSAAHVLSEASSRIGRDGAAQALGTLAQAGYLEYADPEAHPAVSAFCAELGTSYTEARLRLQLSSLQLVDYSSAPSATLRAALAGSGLSLSDSHGDFALVLCDDYRDPRLETWNKQALASGRPWLLAKPNGHNFWVGPHFLPRTEAGPCWKCLDHRLGLNRAAVRRAEKHSGAKGSLRINVAPMPSCASQAQGALVNQVLRLAIQRPHPLIANHLCVVDTLSLASNWHFVVRRPQCPDCGSAASVPAGRATPALPSHAAEHGGVRSESAERTLRRLQHHVSPVTGLVGALHPSPHNETSPIRTYTAGHNFALGGDAPLILRENLRQFSSGKGRTDIEARTGALCEALERYSGLFQGDETRISASLSDLGSAGLDPRQCMLFSERQYEERLQWLQRGSRFQVVPLPFDPGASLEWTPVERFGGGDARHLPTSYLYYGYQHEPQRFFCWADSNGCAAGVTRDDACLQGLLELVERDAVAVWWYNRYQVPGHRPEQLGDAYFRGLQAHYRSIGREFWLLDLTHDLGIPVFCALNRRIAGPTEDIILGFGAHLDEGIAMNRAVTEMNQFMPAVLDVGADGRTRYAFDDPDALAWWTRATIAAHPYLVPLAGATEAARKRCTAAGSAEMLADLADRITGAGLEIYLCDQSRADVGLPVVKMIVPGLRHFWARFAPGRLYDVPLATGRLAAATAEQDLNPVPMFV